MIMTAKKESVRAEKVTIHFDAGKCVHSRNCVLSRPDVFVPNVEGEWIHPERATPDEVAMLALNCPSGAITYERFDGIANEAAPMVNTVRVRENGPLAFHGALSIAGTESFRATLCRCGASAHKPYCDGSHSGAGFAATGEPAAVESTPLSVRNGPLSIAPQANGPLKVSGSLEVVSGTGHTINRTTLTFLCRCGGSANKPYCDGSHKRNGFRAP
jgi:CDGSH-type Zn-finger protein/uncharacterized Fe-S cluster protein YjdI